MHQPLVHVFICARLELQWSALSALPEPLKEKRMNTRKPLESETPTTDPDLVEQAQPGHGVPSQDPDPNAQVGMSAQESDREISSSLVGGGALAGVAVGAAVGAAVAGPVGILVGGTVGSMAGALGAAAAGTSAERNKSETKDKDSLPEK